MFLPAIVVVLLLVLWSIYWLVAIGIAKSETEQQRRRLAERGAQLACTKENWGGYPFRFEFNCSSPVITYRDKAEIRSGNLLAVALAYNPWQVVLLLDGPTTVSGKNLVPQKVIHQRAVASVTIEKMDRKRISIDAEAKMIDVPGRLSAGRVMINTRPGAGSGMDIAVLAEGLNYQMPDMPAFLLDRGDFLGTATPDAALAISRVEIQRGGIRYWGSGSFKLDDSRMIAGRLATETNDLTGLMSLMEPYLKLSEQQKATLNTVLGLLGNKAKADIVAQEGQLYVGPVKVANLHPLF